MLCLHDQVFTIASFATKPQVPRLMLCSRLQGRTASPLIHRVCSRTSVLSHQILALSHQRLEVALWCSRWVWRNHTVCNIPSIDITTSVGARPGGGRGVRWLIPNPSRDDINNRSSWWASSRCTRTPGGRRTERGFAGTHRPCTGAEVSRAEHPDPTAK